jgi:hypothetical protein
MTSNDRSAADAPDPMWEEPAAEWIEPDEWIEPKRYQCHNCGGGGVDADGGTCLHCDGRGFD